MRVQVRRLAVRLAAARAGTSTRAHKTERKSPQIHHMVVFISSQTFSRGGGVQRRELGLQAGEQQRQAYCPTSGVLIDNFAHSSSPVAIICFASAITLQDRTRASPSIRNLASSVFRTALSALCLLHPLQYPAHNPRDCHSSHPQSHVRPSSVEKHLLSNSSHRPLESQHRLCVYTPYHLVHKRSRQCRSL